MEVKDTHKHSYGELKQTKKKNWQQWLLHIQEINGVSIYLLCLLNGDFFFKGTLLPDFERKKNEILKQNWDFLLAI